TSQSLCPSLLDTRPVRNRWWSSTHGLYHVCMCMYCMYVCIRGWYKYGRANPMRCAKFTSSTVQRELARDTHTHTHAHTDTHTHAHTHTHTHTQNIPLSPDILALAAPLPHPSHLKNLL